MLVAFPSINHFKAQMLLYRIGLSIRDLVNLGEEDLQNLSDQHGFPIWQFKQFVSAVQ